ncbi:tetratricopeptide repeat protein [Meiothermus cerbereus]|uniref:tetratricopeptide repeat protein n=1 Tax=Meiothermus cerbereus TaxID=65552 RepID=UPI003EEC6849
MDTVDTQVKRYFRTQFHLAAPLSPGRFEAVLAKRIGSPARRKPILDAWKAYLEAEGGDLEVVRSFYSAVLSHPRERLEALVYAMHLPFVEFYVRVLPQLLPAEGRVLEVGAFTGALVSLLREARPELEWHALEGVAQAVELGQARTGGGVQWHQGWFPDQQGLPSMDAVLLLSCMPEGYLGDLPETLEEAEYLQRFDLLQRLQGLEGLLKPGGLLAYGHGPFLGKNPQAVQHALRQLGFDQVQMVGEGDYTLVTARMPVALLQPGPAQALPTAHAPNPGRPLSLPSVEEIWALLEEGAYAEVLRRLPEGTTGELAYLRGRALLALSRFAEADAALALAHHPEAENLRVLCWAELEDYQRALPRLEELSSRGGRYKLALGKVYLGLGRLSEALRQLYECGLPEADIYLKTTLERIEERVQRLCREGDWSEASRRVEFVEDLSPELLTRGLLRLGLQAALQQGLWGRAARYAQHLYVLGESHGALGLALAGLKVRGPEVLDKVPLADLKGVEPYLTDAVARAEDATALLALGLLRHREGRHTEAVRYLERAVRASRGEAAGLAYHLLALSKRALGLPVLEVLGDHKRAHAHRAYPVTQLFELALEAKEAGEPVLAREFLGRVREAGLQPFSQIEPVLKLVEELEGPWEAFRMLSQSLEGTAEPPLEHLELAYRLSRSFSQSREAETVRGQYLAALYNAGQALGAEGLLLSELARNPEALEVLYDLAEHYERTGAYQKAAQTWRKALEIAYYWEKDLQLSREILRNLLFLNPTDPDLQLYLEELKATSRALATLEGSPDTLAGTTPEGLMREGLPRFHGEYLIVVGGHTQLRSRLTPVLQNQGLELDWFDSDSYAAGREVIRRIQSRLERAHGLMIISSYVGHDLSEPVRLEAENLGVPVYITPGRARGITGFLRAVAEFAPQMFRRALKGG